MKAIYFMLVFLFKCPLVLLAAESQIKPPVRKGYVIPFEARAVVLEFIRNYRSQAGEFELDEEDNPFLFGDFGEEKATEERQNFDVNLKLHYNYTDESILEAAASNLSEKITGSFMLGERHFLQLVEGQMLSSGMHLSVRLPEFGNKTFDLEIESIDTEGFRIKLNESMLFSRFKSESNDDLRVKLHSSDSK